MSCLISDWVRHSASELMHLRTLTTRTVMIAYLPRVERLQTLYPFILLYICNATSLSSSYRELRTSNSVVILSRDESLRRSRSSRSRSSTTTRRRGALRCYHRNRREDRNFQTQASSNHLYNNLLFLCFDSSFTLLRSLSSRVFLFDLPLFLLSLCIMMFIDAFSALRNRWSYA